MEKKERELKELNRLQRLKALPEPKHYFWILIVVLSLIYIVDEQTSNIEAALQSYIVCNFMHVKYPSLAEIINGTNVEYTTALGRFGLISTLGFVTMLILPFYKSLADKWGRKVFLALNTCIMGLGMFVIMVSPNIPIYITGMVLIGLVKSNDVQVMYIMEAAPAKHRAKLCGITKAIALASVSLIGVYRSIFITQTAGEYITDSWRNVLFIPVVFALIIGALSVFMTRETPVFLNERIKFLQSTEEERTKNVEEAKNSNGGVINAFKFIFKHKQLKWIGIVAAIYFGCTGFTSYYESISFIGLADQSMVNTFIIVYPLFNALFTFFNGFIADKWGRRPACISFGIIAFVTFLLWIGSMYLFNLGDFSPIFAGIMYGFCIGALWSFSDIVYLTMSAESSPTELRASVMGSMTLLGTIGGAISMIGIMVCNNLGIATWISCLCFFVPFMSLAILIVIFKIKETKDVDMETVRGDEWD